MHYQAHNEETIREGLQKYGVAGGARVMMSNEYFHAEEAVQSGIYVHNFSRNFVNNLFIEYLLLSFQEN